MGRGLETIGAHAGRKNTASPEYGAGVHNNDQTVGIGFQGYYHPGHKLSRKDMPAVQFNAGVRLIRDLLTAYPGVWIKGHRDMPATNTVCPGSYFPFAAMVAEATRPATGGIVLNQFEYITIQLGAYRNPDNARRELERLRKAGESDAYAIIKDTKAKTYRETSL